MYYVLQIIVNATVRMLLLCCVYIHHCKWVAHVNLSINGDDDDDDDDADFTEDPCPRSRRWQKLAIRSRHSPVEEGGWT